MARARRKTGGCKHGWFKRKRMGKGMSAHQPPLGYRPKPKPKKTAADTGAKDTGAEGTGARDTGAEGGGSSGT